MNMLRRLLLLVGLLTLSGVTIQLCADEASDKTKPASSLDHQLLDDLNNARLEGLDEAR